MSFDLATPSRGHGSAKSVCLCGALMFCALPLCAGPQSQEPRTTPGQVQQTALPLVAQATGSIRGKVIDQSGVAISAAKVTLAREDPAIRQEVLTDDDGQFSFSNLPPGVFHLTISSPNLTPQTFDDTLQPGQAYALPLVMLTVATQVTEVRVTLSPEQQATLEVHDEEKQRVLGFIPDFFVTYSPNPVPLTSKLKFHMALKSATDPFTLAAVGALAGAEQATNKWKQYGQGAAGYAKRYGASYADVAAGTFIGNAILPSVFRQDPRYFYKGKGSKRSRFLHAIAGSFEARSDSDNSKWEPNYSNILGAAAAGGIANLYYPSRNRGAGVFLAIMFTRLGEVTAASVFEEFLGPKFTSNGPAHADSDQP